MLILVSECNVVRNMESPFNIHVNLFAFFDVHFVFAVVAS